MTLSTTATTSNRTKRHNGSLANAAKLLMLAIAPVAAIATPAFAATQTYDPTLTTTGSDAAGNWDTTTADWANAGADAVYLNDGTTTPTFGSGGTVGAVTVTTDVKAAGINFNLGYTLGGTSNITLTAPTITVAATQSATINAPLLGTAGLTVLGNLTLGSASTFTGNVSIPAGSLVTVKAPNTGTVTGTPPTSVGPNSALGLTTPGSGNISIANGGTLSLVGTANNVINFGSKVISFAGNGTLGTGAIINPSTTIREFDAFNFLTLTGDALVSGSRMDIGRDGDGVNPDVLDLAGHTLSINMNLAAQPMFGIQAAGNNKSNTVGTIVTAGQIDVLKGSLDIELNANLSNDGTSKITFENTGTLGNTGANVEFFKSDGVSCTRPMVFKGNNIIAPGAANAGATVGSNMTITGVIAFESDVSGNVSNNTANCTLTITGNIVENGTASVSQLGSSTTVLAGTNNWTGGTEVERTGTITLASAGALPVGTPMSFGNAAGLGGTLDLGGFNGTVSTLSVTGASAATSFIGNSSTTAPSTLIYTGITANPSTFTGTIQDVVTANINVAGIATLRTGTQTTGLTVSSGLLTLSATDTYTGNTTVTGGELDIASAASIASANITVGAGGTFAVIAGGSIPATASITNNGTVNLNNPTHTFASLNGTGAGAVVNLNSTNLTVSGGAYAGAVKDNGSNGALTVASALSVGSFNVATVNANAPIQIHAASKTAALNLTGASNAWTSGLDLTSGKLILEATAGNKASLLAQTQNQVTFGKTHPNGIFTSSTLASNFAVAVLDNAALNKTSFGGVAVDATSIMVSAELLGDSNADGKVDLTDLSTVLNNFGVSTTAWTNGNFDGAATIDLTDLSDVLNNFGVTNPNASDALSAAPAIAATPEPASLAILTLGAAALLTRRRKA